VALSTKSQAFFMIPSEFMSTQGSIPAAAVETPAAISLSLLLTLQ